MTRRRLARPRGPRLPRLRAAAAPAAAGARRGGGRWVVAGRSARVSARITARQSVTASNSVRQPAMPGTPARTSAGLRAVADSPQAGAALRATVAEVRRRPRGPLAPEPGAAPGRAWPMAAATRGGCAPSRRASAGPVPARRAGARLAAAAPAARAPRRLGPAASAPRRRGRLGLPAPSAPRLPTAPVPSDLTQVRRAATQTDPTTDGQWRAWARRAEERWARRLDDLLDGEG